MLVAKSNKAHQVLGEDFKKHAVKREYIALLKGVFPNNKALIDAPIGRDTTNRKRMCITDKNSKKAITHLNVIKRYKENTLVSLNLETGRTHQIRVHMKYIGYPVFNDPVYGTRKIKEYGQFLHSKTIDFIHPITKVPMHFSCPLPDYFQDYLDTLEEI
jgi:23S rRNA pseudouridine1911/1915/1917 synthase